MLPSDTDKDEDSVDAGCHDEDILQEGCRKGAEKDNAAGALQQMRKHTSTHGPGRLQRPRRQALTRKPSRCASVAIGTSPRSIICSVWAGAEAMQLNWPDGVSEDLDRNVEELIDVYIQHPHVRSVELQAAIVRHLLCAETETFIGQGTPIGAVGGLAWTAIVRLVRAMRSSAAVSTFWV